MGESTLLVPAPILKMAFSLYHLLPVLAPVLLPVLVLVLLPVLELVLLPVLLAALLATLQVVLLSPLLHSDAFMEEVAGAPGKELALLASLALWHPLT